MASLSAKRNTDGRFCEVLESTAREAYLFFCHGYGRDTICFGIGNLKIRKKGLYCTLPKFCGLAMGK